MRLRAVAPVGNHRFGEFAVLGAIFAHGTLGDRVMVASGVGGRGAVPVLLVACMCVMLTVASAGVMRRRKALSTASMWFGGLALGSCLALLPWAGVAIRGLPVHAVAGGIEGIVIIAALLTGATWVNASNARRERLLTTLSAVLACHAIFAIYQAAALASPNVAGVSAGLLEWDIRTQAQLSELYVVRGRATGLFINPNTLGLAGVMGTAVALALAGGWCRLIAGSAAAVCIVLSQSRAALVAEGVLLGVWWLGSALHGGAGHLRSVSDNAAKGRPEGSRFRGVLMITILVGALGVGTWETLGPRIVSMLGAVLGGTTDTSLSGRLEAWDLALGVLEGTRLGTLGPPQMVIGRSIDSELVRLLAQGGALLGLCYCAMVVVFAKLTVSPAPPRRLIGGAGCALVTGGVAMPVLGGIPGVWFFLLLGSTLIVGPGSMAETEVTRGY